MEGIGIRSFIILALKFMEIQRHTFYGQQKLTVTDIPHFN
jgi:hypothetical protein